MSKVPKKKSPSHPLCYSIIILIPDTCIEEPVIDPPKTNLARAETGFGFDKLDLILCSSELTGLSNQELVGIQQKVLLFLGRISQAIQHNMEKQKQL